MAWKSTIGLPPDLKSASLSFLPYVIIYFFLNNVLLPEGLLYTTLLAPIFLYFLYKKEKLGTWLKWSLLLLVPVPFHLYAGIDPGTYFISTVLVVTSWLFFFTALSVARVIRDEPDFFFSRVLLLNSILVAIALVFLILPGLRDTLWYSVPLSKGIDAFPRLKLLAYEPSHYALLLSPVFLFYLLKIMTNQARHPLILLAAVVVPLILSLSFGVLGAMAISIIFVFIIRVNKLHGDARRFFIYGTIAITLASVAVVLLWPSNPVAVRLENIFSGTDTSASGRLVYSFMFAKDLILQHGVWMGVGPGQVKILAHDMIVNFYQYSGEHAELVRIPNSMAEMLATYGIYGFSLKIFLELFFFFRLKIYRNLYSFTLFMFIFIYQFTGSFIVNAAELGTWAIVYAARFPSFEIKDQKNTEL